MSFRYNIAMSTATYFDRFLGPISDAPTLEVAQAIAEIRVDEGSQSDVASLATKTNTGNPSPVDRAEDKALVDAADLISVLRFKSRRFLAWKRSPNARPMRLQRDTGKNP